MSKKLTNTQVQEFLQDFKDRSSIEILEEGKEKNELLESARKRGIIISKDDRDLGVIKTIYCFTSKANSNRARLPKDEFVKIFPQIVGRPMDYAHDRQFILGFYIDYKYILKDEKAIAYAVFFKSNYPKLWDKVKKFQKKKKLSSSFEIWSPEESRENLEDGTYYLHNISIAGGALIFEEHGDQPAFKDAKVLSIAKNLNLEERIGKDCLVCASKYKEEEIIVAEDYFMKDVRENFRRLQEEKKLQEKKKAEVKKEEPKKEVKVEPKKPEVKVEDKKEEPKPEEKKVEPQSSKIKCSNCSEELDYNGIDVRIKCTKCFAILNKEGVMQYPPQIRNFKMLCPACKVNNWLILSKTDEETKLRCESCAKEFKIEFTQEDPRAKKILNKLNLIRKDIVHCYQCGHSINLPGLSTIKDRSVKCPKCSIEFEFNIESKQYKKISKIEEIKIDKIEKSTKTEKGGKEMGYKLELSKFHRYVEKFEDFEKSLPKDYVEINGYIEPDRLEADLIVSARLTTKQRNALPDSDFAVVVRVKDKRTGKMRKIKMFPINDKSHVRNALARLGQPAPQATLKRLGVSIESTNQKILARARKLGMTELLERYKKAKVEPKKAEKINCSCIKCGHKVTSTEHCVNLKCSKCGGQMRRTERPGDGKPEEKKKAKKKIEAKKEPEKKIEVKVVVDKAKAEVKVGKAKDNDLELYALEDKIAKYTIGIRKLASKVRSTNKELKIAKLETEKKVKFYKENAKKVLKRREELGETAKDLTDEQIVNDKDFKIAKLEKEVAEKNTAKIETASEIVGDKNKDNEYYAKKHKEIDAIAYKETENTL